jgi:pimeloyl-ACP methyl ester carboxylesterase
MKEALRMLVADEEAVTSDMVERALASKRIDGAQAGARGHRGGDLGRRARRRAWPRTARRRGARPDLWGDADRVIPPGAGATLVEGAGHMPHMEASAKVAGLIAAHVGAAS